MEWPSHIVLRDGRVLVICEEKPDMEGRVGFYVDRNPDSQWHTVVKSQIGEMIPVPEDTKSFVYYRPTTDALTIAMVKALAAKQPEDKAG
jgi:hypothetical protein